MIFTYTCKDEGLAVMYKNNTFEKSVQYVHVTCVLPLGGSRTGILNGARTVLYEAERG